MRIVARIVLAGVLLTAALGCGSKPKLVTVTGKVTHKTNAVTGGSVWFHAVGVDPDKADKVSGQLQLDGTFTARTFPHGDGIQPGQYKVTLSPDLAARVGHPRLAEVAKTPWALDVPGTGSTDHHFEVK